MRITSIVAVCALALTLAGSVGAEPSRDVAAGSALFMKNGCYECHGTVGQGNRNAGVQLAPHTLPLAALTQQLRKPRGEMPPYSTALLSDADVGKIHAYLSSISDGKHAAQIALLSDVTNGNASAGIANDPLAAGRIVYAQNCTGCHGASGVGGGIGPALVNEKARKDLAATIAVIKNPKMPMPALFPKTLSERDVAAVAAYVQSL